MPFTSIKARLSLSLSLLLIFGFATTNLMNYYESKKALRTSIVDDALPLISNNIYSEIQRDLMRPIQISSLMANDAFLKDWAIKGETNLKLIIRYLDDIKESYGFDTSFFVSEKTGTYYYFKGIFKNISCDDDHDVWYFNFKDKNVPMVLDVDTDEAAKSALTVFINHRLTAYNGEFLGVTGVGLRMNNLGKILENYEKEFSRNVYLVDDKGMIAVHSESSRFVNTDLFEQSSSVDLKSYFNDAKLNGKTPLIEFDRKNRHILMMVRYIPEFNWYLVVEQNESASLEIIQGRVIKNLVFGFFITCFVIGISILTVNIFQGRLETAATTDFLTGLSNRRHFMAIFEQEFKKHIRYKHALSLLMIDADRFKEFNDAYGHPAGDEALKKLGEVLKNTVRETDIPARLGGEEFAVLLPVTNTKEAMILAERIRAAVWEMNMETEKGAAKLSVSIGVSESFFEDETKNGIDLLKAADKALYRAKSGGRNRVEA